MTAKANTGWLACRRRTRREHGAIASVLHGRVGTRAAKLA